MKKNIFILLICLLFVFTVPMFTYSPDDVSSHISEISEFTNTGKALVNIFQVIGAFVAVAVLGYIGIKYMIAAPSEKAQLKTAAIPYIIGAIVVFSAIVLSTILYNIAAKF